MVLYIGTDVVVDIRDTEIVDSIVTQKRVIMN